MKRSIADVELGTLELARYLVFLSQDTHNTKLLTENPKEIFECKTCNRRFSSFQALGGHTASHKKTKLSETKVTYQGSNLALSQSTTLKSKMHECSICGLRFSMGQALGGHMRRHRTNGVKEKSDTDLSLFAMVPVLKRSNSSKRVVPNLDLNLTPLENDLKLLLSKMAPKI